MSKRFELINFLNSHDYFKDNKNNTKLDSFDVVKLLNHYDKLQILLAEKDKQIAELQKQVKEQPKEIVKRIIYHYDLNPIRDQFKNGFYGAARCVAIDGLGLIIYLEEILKEYQK